MGNWIPVESDDQVQLCSIMLQTSRPRYKGHLTFNNLSNLLSQTNDDDGSDMFEMYLYQDSDTADYDMVLVEYRSLKRDSDGNPTKDDWCLTFGLSPLTTKSPKDLYAILRPEVQKQMNDEGITFWYVYLDGDTFNSGSPFDTVVQLLFAEVQATTVKATDHPEPTYGAYQKDNGKATLHRYQITNMT